MKFVRERPYSSTICCGILGFVAMSLAIVAFRENSWAKWRKKSAMMECLPLPPPLGCSDQSSTAEVLKDDETDFAWLTFISIFPSCCHVISCFLSTRDHDLKSAIVKELVSSRSQSRLMLATGILNILCCMIAMLRINVISAIRRNQSFYQFSDMNAVYSSSYYCSMLSSTSAFISSVCHKYISQDISQDIFRMAKTIKQHLARNLMYPDNKRTTKMVTFSSMNPEMEEAATEIAVRAVMQYKLEEDIAENVKQTFEAKFGPTWHCAAGSEFGSAVHHRAHEYIEIATPQISVLLFRCDEPKQAELNTQSTVGESGSLDSLDLR
ncbi:uncharacterized protein LOC120347740 [Styela clava]|uniref:uncharacterized protein LOC120347740 n=1 Tax=Styela clava TaxID=7725 RepID=UPI00193A711F|nr:uncharacterized protein LOC120347740 [Styela clava]